MHAAADFGCGAWQSGGKSGGGEGIFHDGHHEDKKIQTGMRVPVSRAAPHSHCWPGWHGSGRVTALGPAGGPARPS